MRKQVREKVAALQKEIGTERAAGVAELVKGKVPNAVAMALNNLEKAIQRVVPRDKLRSITLPLDTLGEQLVNQSRAASRD